MKLSAAPSDVLWGRMEVDTDKIDAAVLALLSLTLHNERRAWKNFDWDTLGRLHDKGLRRFDELFEQLFSKRA